MDNARTGRCWIRLGASCILVGAVIAGCDEPSAGPACKAFPEVGPVHTRGWFDSEQRLFDFADQDATPVQLKFTLANFHAERPGPAYFLDPAFFALHDEWYWMTLLSGREIPGWGVKPPTDQPVFQTVQEVYDAVRQGHPPPLDLAWVGNARERLYSSLFYEAALQFGQFEGEKRFFGIGSLLYFPAHPARLAFPDELWAFELEYHYEKGDVPVIERFFETLESCLPETIAPRLMWVSRGTVHQDDLVDIIRGGGGRLANRVLTYRDLAVAGEFDVYNPGIAAGRIRRYDGTLGGSSMDSETIVVASVVPDELPPVAGIITATPQTPLAHLSLLAKARGTPNGYLGGVLGDPQLLHWESIRAPVAVRIDPDDGVEFLQLSNSQYQDYRARLGLFAAVVPQVDLSDAPLTVNLDAVDLDDMRPWVPTIGGKCAGFIALSGLSSLEIPHAPICITVRPYREHLEPFIPSLEALLEDEVFQHDSRVRFVALEGIEGYREAHDGDGAALAWLELWVEDLVPGSIVEEVVSAGGFKRLLRDRPMEWPQLQAVEAALSERFAELSPEQGIRFRSSSTAEDIPGFNGAGLYDSNTGFLRSWAVGGKSVEWALKKTWASYWSYEAFEERKLAGIDHLSGNMAVLAHPRFDDLLERANGVVTFNIVRDGAGAAMTMVVNAQSGFVSVTNPDPNEPAVAEITRVSGTSLEDGVIQRVQPSSLPTELGIVMSDAELQRLYTELAQLATAWLDDANSAWPLAQQSSSLTLDLEFKRMDAAWPTWSAMESTTTAERLVMKQVRVLDRPMWVSEATQSEPIPRDILVTASRVVRRWCTAATLHFETVEVHTDPAAGSAFEFGETNPFTARASLEVETPLEGLPFTAGPWSFDHTQLLAVMHIDSGPLWRVRYEVAPEAAPDEGTMSFEFAADGSYFLQTDEVRVDGDAIVCGLEDLEVGASEYLERVWQQALSAPDGP